MWFILKKIFENYQDFDSTNTEKKHSNVVYSVFSLNSSLLSLLW